MQKRIRFCKSTNYGHLYIKIYSCIVLYSFAYNGNDLNVLSIQEMQENRDKSDDIMLKVDAIMSMIDGLYNSEQINSDGTVVFQFVNKPDTRRMRFLVEMVFEGRQDELTMEDKNYLLDFFNINVIQYFQEKMKLAQLVKNDVLHDTDLFLQFAKRLQIVRSSLRQDEVIKDIKVITEDILCRGQLSTIRGKLTKKFQEILPVFLKKNVAKTVAMTSERLQTILQYENYIKTELLKKNLYCEKVSFVGNDKDLYILIKTKTGESMLLDVNTWNILHSYSMSTVSAYKFEQNKLLYFAHTKLMEETEIIRSIHDFSLLTENVTLRGFNEYLHTNGWKTLFDESQQFQKENEYLDRDIQLDLIPSFVLRGWFYPYKKISTVVLIPQGHHPITLGSGDNVCAPERTKERFKGKEAVKILLQQEEKKYTIITNGEDTEIFDM